MPLNQQITINVANEVVGINVKIINIPEDSLRLTLTEQVEKIRKSKDLGDIIGALGLLGTSIAALASGYDENSAIPRQVYNIVFWVGLIGGIIDLGNCIRNFPKKPVTVEDVMNEINRRMTGCSCSVKDAAPKPKQEQQHESSVKINKPKKKRGKGRR